MANNYKIGISIMAFFAMVLLVTSPAAAMPVVDSINTNTLGTDPSMEFASIVAGKGTATYNEIVAFGADDGGNYPAGVEGTTGFAEAASWLVIFSSQDGFEADLNRRPLETPDGLTLHLYYPSSGSSFNWAVSAQSTIASLYGVDMSILVADTVSDPNWDVYIFYNDSDIFSAVADDVDAISDAGFGTLIDSTTVTGSDFSWAGYGAHTFFEDGALVKTSAHGAGWVDSDGITSASDPDGPGFIHTISTSTIGDLNAIDNAADGLSRIKITVPYAIEPVTDGISPFPTSNPLPHVTGRMEWDLRNPAGHTVADVAEYKVTYRLGMDRNFPSVSNEFSVDQTLLSEGTLKAEFDLLATGQDAHNVELRFPLGPDFGDIANQNITYYKIKDAYDIYDHTADYTVNVTFSNPLLDQFEYGFPVLSLTGWFNSTNNTPAFWDLGTTQLDLYTKTGVSVSGFTTDITVRIEGDDGFPQVFVDNIALIESIVTGYTLAQLENIFDTDLPGKIKVAFNDSFHEFFEPVQMLVVNGNDFTLEKLPVAIDEAEVREEWFMTKTIPLLEEGVPQTLNFNISGIPSQLEALPFMQFEVLDGSLSTVFGTQNYKHVFVDSEEANYNDVLRYAFQLAGIDGRPLSFSLPSDFSLDFDEFADTYGSMGMRFRYENANGFEFFGLSNGLNLQIADDEATISSVVSFENNKQVYFPGDEKVINVALTNNGDIAATDVVVHVFHSTLGRDYQIFERVEKIDEVTVGVLNPGQSTTVQVSTTADSFLGYSPVFAIVEFVSDAGQGAEDVPDFLDVDPNSNTIGFEAGAETHQFVMSTLAGALLVPESDVLAPAIPEARLEVEVANTLMNQNGEVTFTYTISNVGDAPTTVEMIQFFDPDELDVSTSDVTVPAGASKVVIDNADADTGLVTIGGVELVNGTSVEFTITVTDTTTSDGFMLPPATVTYTMDGESSLGDSVQVIPSPAQGNAAFLGLSAGAAAQQQSQQSATEDSQSAAYSSSTSVGAAVNTGANTDEQTATGGFLGISPIETLGLMLIPLSLFSIIRRRK